MLKARNFALSNILCHEGRQTAGLYPGMCS